MKARVHSLLGVFAVGFLAIAALWIAGNGLTPGASAVAFPGAAAFWSHQAASLLLLACGLALPVLGGLLVRRRHLRRITAARRDIAVELLDSMPVGLLLIDRDGTVVYVNEEILQVTPGGSRQMRAGLNFRRAMRALIDQGTFDLEGRSPAEMLTLMAEDGLVDGACHELRMATGAVFLRSAHRLAGGETLVVRQDISEERARLEQIEKLNRSLSEQVRIATLNNVDLRALAYATSHDLKSPTNTAIMLTETLRQDLADRLSGEEAELFDDLSDTLDQTAALIDEVLCYTDTLGADLPGETVDMNRIAAEVLSENRNAVVATGARTTLGHLPQVFANETQMRLLLRHLVSNALKFRSADRTPEIRIEPIEKDAEWIGFQVSDNGIGIDPEYHDRVFNLFQRLHPNSIYKGAGLGLAICHRIVLNHCGRIRLDSRPGKGTCFTVLFRKDMP